MSKIKSFLFDKLSSSQSYEEQFCSLYMPPKQLKTGLEGTTAKNQGLGSQALRSRLKQRFNKFDK